MSTQDLKKLSLSDFDFEVPEAQVAQIPTNKRDCSRLLFKPAQGAIETGSFSDLAKFIPDQALIILNNSEVFASRLFARLETGGKVELFLLEYPKGESFAEAVAIGKPMKKLHKGTTVYFENKMQAQVVEKTNAALNTVKLRFNATVNELVDWLNDYAYVPLPPYIKRANPVPKSQSEDAQRYQTIYAQNVGSVAAPTAGLHFTDAVFGDLKAKGVDLAYVTLHVGAGTFLPVKSENLDEHAMHREVYHVPKTTLAQIEEAQKNARPIVVVGTTALRCLESFSKISKEQNLAKEQLADQWLSTDLFIKPEYKHSRHKPWCADYMITNFHQPKSTLFMLICALLGYDEAKKVYDFAIKDGYRFYSYGDACLFEL